MNARQKRQVKGIAGMGLAVLGGIAWFFQMHIPAVVAWAGAFVILMSLNRRKRQS
jgi:hypothetical protein